MAATQISVSAAKLWYGTASEITALDTTDSANVGDVGYATDENREYTCTDNTDTAPVWKITREHDAIGGAFVNPEKGPLGYDLDGVSIAYTVATSTPQAITTTAPCIDVLCTTDAYIVIASSSTNATSAGYFCAAGLTYRFPFTSTYYIAAIRDTVDGTMHVHPVG